MGLYRKLHAEIHAGLHTKSISDVIFLPRPKCIHRLYRDDDKALARPQRKQANDSARMA